MEEAALLRRSGIRGELLVLGITPQELYPAIAEYDVVQTVSSLAYASQLADCGPVRVHIKIDTGMSRLGLYCHTPEDVARTAEDVARIAALPGLKVEGIFTHFAESDAPRSDFTRRQFAVFSALLAELERRGVDCGLRHCCNSAGILNFPEMHLDMVRAGIALYGCDPSPESRDAGLRPAMSLHSRVAFVSRIRPGDTVSYGRSYTADRPLDTAVISIGYARRPAPRAFRPLERAHQRPPCAADRQNLYGPLRRGCDRHPLRAGRRRRRVRPRQPGGGDGRRARHHSL